MSHANCHSCGDLVELTKAGALRRHGQRKRGRHVVEGCPGSGTRADGSLNHGRLAEVREWDRKIAKYVDRLLDGDIQCDD